MAPSPDCDDPKDRFAYANQSGDGVELFPTAKPHLGSVRSYQPGKPIEEVERELGIRNAIKMASNENALGPSPKAVAAVRRALKNIHRYPDGGCFYLRKKVADFLGVDAGNLVFGNGSDELLVFAVRAFVGAGDEVILADPTFLIYEIAACAENGRAIKVPVKDFKYDLDGMAARISPRTKLIFIANPDNPVGTYISEEKLLKFIKAVPEGIVVILDEAYYEFASNNRDYPDSLKLLKLFPNLVVTRTFSKAYGLSGLRIGYGVMDERIANTLNKLREPFNVNFPAQAAAAAALEDGVHLKKTLKAVKDGRAFLTHELSEMKLGLVKTATNFMLVDLKRDAKGIYEKLLRAGVIIRPMGAWGLKNFIRVTIGRAQENKRFIKELKRSLA